MITETIEAWQVDTGDVITLGGDETFIVVECDTDEQGGTSMTLDDGDGMLETFFFTDTDPIFLFVSLDEPDTEE